MTRTSLVAVSLATALLAPHALAEDAPAADLARGAELFVNCTQCHQPQGGGDPLALAPAIAGLPQWYVASQLEKFQHGLRGTNPRDIQGMRMLPMSRTLKSEADVQAVAAYVESLPPQNPAPTLAGGDAQRGKQLYQMGGCVPCHGLEAQGNQALNGPPLVHQSDWYLLSSLERYKAGVRGANPADRTGILMGPMANTLPDEQAMKDVIAHIEALSR